MGTLIRITFVSGEKKPVGGGGVVKMISFEWNKPWQMFSKKQNIGVTIVPAENAITGFEKREMGQGRGTKLASGLEGLRKRDGEVKSRKGRCGRDFDWQ